VMLPCQADLHYFDSRSHTGPFVRLPRLIVRSAFNILLPLAHESQIRTKTNFIYFLGSRKEKLSDPNKKELAEDFLQQGDRGVKNTVNFITQK
jgi:hypothetical protein